MSEMINVDFPAIAAISVAATVIIVFFMTHPLVATIVLNGTWS